MKVEIEKSYPMPAPAAATWALLQDIEAVAACMPGAKITERLDAGRYKGTVTVRLGPATMAFRGEVEMKDVDPAAMTLRLLGKGTDSTGSSVATLNLAARVAAAEAGRSTLVGNGEVSVSGKAAAFGGRMMNMVADQVLKQFADNFAARVGAIAEPPAAAVVAGPAAPDAPAATAPALALPEPASPSPAPPPPVAELNGLALAWAVIARMAARPVRQEDGMSLPGRRMDEIAALQEELQDAGYVAEPALAAALLLMLELGRPLLLEGDAGVGKTEVAKALAAVRGARLIRLQCYEGLDVHSAMYEWNYQRQLLAIKLLEHDDRPAAVKEQDIFSERYLLKRPLLEAIGCDEAPVLLIDEVDRADEAFEAYLLELLSDFQMTIPELGTVHAVTRPLVVVTSNGTRELSDALRRRCLYQYIDYPSFAKELAIVEIRAPQAAGELARQIVAFVQSVRRMELRKRPGIAETLDWTAALLRLGISSLDEDGAERILDTLSAMIKTREDRTGFTREVVAKIAAAC